MGAGRFQQLDGLSRVEATPYRVYLQADPGDRLQGQGGRGRPGAGPVARRTGLTLPARGRPGARLIWALVYSACSLARKFQLRPGNRSAVESMRSGCQRGCLPNSMPRGSAAGVVVSGRLPLHLGRIEDQGQRQVRAVGGHQLQPEILATDVPQGSGGRRVLQRPAPAQQQL